MAGWGVFLQGSGGALLDFRDETAENRHRSGIVKGDRIGADCTGQRACVCAAGRGRRALRRFGADGGRREKLTGAAPISHRTFIIESLQNGTFRGVVDRAA